MKNRKLVYLFIFLISGIYFLSCSPGNKNAVFTTNNFSAIAYNITAPVLKGLSVNPTIKLVLAVPAAAAEQTISSLQCEINESILADIEKIDLYLTADEPFSNKKLLASVSPKTSHFQIPVNLTQKQGVSFLWLSVVLKSSASINQKINLRCLQIENASGKNYTVQQNSGNERYLGYAIRKAGDDGVNTYRIPGIVQTDKGTLLSVYDIRYNNAKDLPENIDVGLSRSTDGGTTWQPMKVIMDMGAPHENNGIGDPSILFDPVTKKIWVAALWSKGNRSIAGSLPGLSPDVSGQFVLVSSDDDGLTWSAPYNITSQVKDPKWHIFFNGPGNGIAMQDGKLVFAAQYWDENKMPFSTIIYSDDKGVSWKGKITGPKSNTTESQVVETTPGTLMLNMRDNRGGFRSVATTNNLGNSWVEHASSFSKLIDPVCMASLIKANVKIKGQLKEVLFFSNPNTNNGRYNITIKASLDLGETWLPVNELLIDERPSYGYSSLSQIDEETIGILYEGIKDLYFVKIPVADIVK